MGIKKVLKSNLRELSNTVKYVSAMKTGTKAVNKATKENIKGIGIQLAKKNYTAKTGMMMTPSKLKEDQGFRIPKATREYMKDKRVITKAKIKKYGM